MRYIKWVLAVLRWKYSNMEQTILDQSLSKRQGEEATNRYGQQGLPYLFTCGQIFLKNDGKVYVFFRFWPKSRVLHSIIICQNQLFFMFH